jgi:IclR family transcriptional regulator, KDG regulon repressor
MKNREMPEQLVQSLDRALDILEKLVEVDGGCGVTELGNSLGLHKSTIYRLLATLHYRGYVEQDPVSRDYRVGLKLLEIGSMVLNKLDLRTQAKPFLIELMKETKETIHLGVMNRGEIVYIDKVEGTETIRMYSHIGVRVPVHCTSLGKIILAFSTPQMVELIIREQGLNRYTENTITSHDDFIEHLKTVKKQGFAVDDEEQEEGIRCIGGPIFDYNGDVIAAFSISGPAIRMTEERVRDLSNLVLLYSKKISAAFGYNGFSS